MGSPQLGAGDPFGIRQTLSDKELQSVVDDPVEYGLCPGGSFGQTVPGPQVSSPCPVPVGCGHLSDHMPCTWSVLLGEVPWLQKGLGRPCGS